MQIVGKIIQVGQTEQATEKLTKRELIVEYAENPQYPEELKFEAINDKCAIFDNLSAGQTVTVDFNLRGRKWVNKKGVAQWFNSLQAWKVTAKTDF